MLHIRLKNIHVTFYKGSGLWGFYKRYSYLIYLLETSVSNMEQNSAIIQWLHDIGFVPNCTSSHQLNGHTAEMWHWVFSRGLECMWHHRMSHRTHFENTEMRHTQVFHHILLSQNDKSAACSCAADLGSDQVNTWSVWVCAYLVSLLVQSSGAQTYRDASAWEDEHTGQHLKLHTQDWRSHDITQGHTLGTFVELSQFSGGECEKDQLFWCLLWLLSSDADAFVYLTKLTPTPKHQYSMTMTDTHEHVITWKWISTPAWPIITSSHCPKRSHFI